MVLSYIFIHNLNAGHSSSFKKFPPFKLAVLQSENPEQYDFHPEKGQFYIINFWASWCDVCASEKEFLAGLSARRDLPLEVIGIVVYDTREKVLKSGRLEKLNYKILLDHDGFMPKALGFSAIPQTFLIDDKFRIIMHIEGALNEKRISQIEKKIRAYGEL